MIKIEKVTFKAFKRLNIHDRIAAIKDPYIGGILMSTMTPYQIADLFPRYYLQSLPDISGFLKALPSSVSVAKQQAYEEQLSNTVTGEGAGRNMAAGGWRKKLQENINNQTARVLKPGQVPEPQLSPEQTAIVQRLQGGENIAASDPNLKFLANISPQQLKMSGLERFTNEKGEEFFRYVAPQITEEQAKASLESSSQIGSASRKYESGNRGVDMISSGAGDPGGVSYGSHQLSTKDGMPDFLKSPEGAPYAGRFAGLRPGTPEFNNVYRQIAAQNPGAFDQAQHAYISRTHYEPVKQYAAKLGFDINNPKVQETLFSMGVQHGHATEIVGMASAGARGTPEQQVQALFAARRQYVLSPAVNQPGLLHRYASEERDILGYTSSRPVAGDYTKEAIYAEQQRLLRQQQVSQIKGLAAAVHPGELGLPQPGSPQAAAFTGGSESIQTVANKIYAMGQNQGAPIGRGQCVDLAREYVGSHESVTTWRKGENVLSGNLRPGTPIATFMDAKGNPSDRYDAGGTGRPGNHTTHAAVFTGYERDRNGNITGIKVIEQWKGQAPRQATYPINSSKFGTGNGGNYYAINNSEGTPLGGDVGRVQVASAVKNDTTSSQVKQAEIASERIKQSVAAPPSQDPTEHRPVPHGRFGPGAEGQQGPAAIAPTIMQPPATDPKEGEHRPVPHGQHKLDQTSSTIPQQTASTPAAATQDVAIEAQVSVNNIPPTPDQAVSEAAAGGSYTPQAPAAGQQGKSTVEQAPAAASSSQRSSSQSAVGQQQTKETITQASAQTGGQTATVKQQKAEPPSPAKKFNIDMPKFIAKVKEMDWRANMATDSMIIEGFNADPQVRAAGVKIDDKGVIHFKDYNNPDVQKIVGDMNAKSFMTEIKEAPKVEPKPAEPVKSKPTPAPAHSGDTTVRNETTKTEKQSTAKNTPQQQPGQVVNKVENNYTNQTQVQPQQSVGTVGSTPTNSTNPQSPAPVPQGPQGQPKIEKVTPDKTEKVPTRAYGGEVSTNTDQISAYPIGGLKGDNSVVVDAQQQPIFTMNTDREKAVFDPQQQKVDVIPNQKNTQMPITSPPDSKAQELKMTITNVVKEMKQSFENTEPASQTNVMNPRSRDSQYVSDRPQSMINDMLDMAGITFKNPTAARSLAARPNFQETGGPTSHYNYGDSAYK